MSNLMSCRDLPSGMFFTRLGRALISKCIVGLCLLVAPGLGVAQSVVTGWGADYYGQATAPAGLTNVTAISGGCEYSLALKSDGTVAQWGGGPNAPVGTPASADFAAIAAGCFHALALKFDGTVFAWGYNGNGQADVPENLTNVVAIAAGLFHSLALKSNGTVVAWGSGVVGQSDVPAGLEGVVAIAAGERHSLALKSDCHDHRRGTDVFNESARTGRCDVSLALWSLCTGSDGSTPGLLSTRGRCGARRRDACSTAQHAGDFDQRCHARRLPGRSCASGQSARADH